MAAWPLLITGGTALAQDSAELVLESGPQDIPGVEKGPRTRATPETVAPPVEPAASKPPDEWFGSSAWWHWKRATGNWGGFRDQLEDRGVTLAGSYTLDWLGVWDGGASRRASTRSLLDFNLSIDLEKIAGCSGATFFADFYSTDGRGQSDVGDFQGVSNIETDENDDQLAEIWFERWFFEKHARLKVGKIDANTEFAFVDAAGEFTHSAAGISPTIVNAPTYPDPAFGAAAFVYPTDRVYAGLGFFDGAAGDGLRTGGHGLRTFLSDDKSSDWFWIAELGFTWKEFGPLGKGRLAGDLWHHSGTFETFDGSRDQGTTGFFAMVEQQLLRRGDRPAEGAEDPGADQGVFAFFQFGWADEDISEARLHIAGGISLSGTFDGRDDDAAGIYISWVDLSDEAGAGFAEDETAIQAFYKWQVVGSISLRPSLTYIINPGGDASLDDAVVGGLRLSIEF